MNLEKVIFTVSIFFASLDIHGQSKDSIEVTRAMQRFVKSFVNFDWITFRNSFSKDATIFFPSWEEGKRRSGRKEIEETWTDLFPEFIDSTKKFDLEIDPKDVLIQLHGNTAIVTFHLNPRDTYLSRRTLVLIKENEQWKIAHLHASTLSKK